ncbi:MAG: FtsQ-type POTRA domain-containing protein, partial [Deltaproteobacteria bacterium]
LVRIAVVVALGGLASAAAAYAAVAIVWPAFASRPYSRVKSVKVVCDSRAAEPAALASMAGLFDGTTLWQIDADAAEHALESVPWVEDARIERRFPAAVRLEVRRRRPVAATVGPDGPYLIDAQGVVFREAGSRAYPDLPYLTGWQSEPDRGVRIQRLRLAIDLLSALEEDAQIRVSQIDVDPRGVFRLYLDGRRLPLVLGRRPTPERVAARVRAVVAALPEKLAGVREVDLSYGDRAVVRVADGRVVSLLAALAGAQTSGGNDRG